MPTWLSVIIGFFVFIVMCTISRLVRTRRIAASRVGENFDTFCDAFKNDQVPPDVLRTVYAKFQKWCSDAVAEFPVRATDNIADVYGMVDEDVDDAMIEVVVETGRELPSSEKSLQMRPVDTVHDFVLFIAECPENIRKE